MIADLGDGCTVEVRRPSITVTRVSPTEIRVLLPIAGGKSSEWSLQAYPGTGCWGIWSVRGVVGSTLIPLVEDGSTMEYAFQIGADSDPYQSGVTFDFVGGGHGSEKLRAVGFTLDGKPVTAPTTLGAELVVSQLIETVMPRGAMAGQVIGATHLRHRFTASGVQVEHSHAITMPGVVYRTAYAAMLPGCKATANRAKCDTMPAVALEYNDTIPATGLRGSTYALWHTDPAVNPFRLTMRLEAPEIGGAGWALASPPGAWLFDRAAYPKWYANWIGDTVTPARYSVHRQTYSVE